MPIARWPITTSPKVSTSQVEQAALAAPVVDGASLDRQPADDEQSKVCRGSGIRASSAVRRRDYRLAVSGCIGLTPQSQPVRFSKWPAAIDTLAKGEGGACLAFLFPKSGPSRLQLRRPLRALGLGQLQQLANAPRSSSVA